MLAATTVALLGFNAYVPLPRTSVVNMPRAVAAEMNFFDDMQAKFQEMMAPPPTLEEAELYCRDDESVGCTVDMCARRGAP